MRTRLLAALAATLTSLLLFSAPAQAAPGDASCLLGTGVTTYTPPISLTPASTTIDEDLNLSCTSVPDPAVTSAQIDNTETATLSCLLTIPGSLSGTLFVVWNTNEVSFFEYTRTTVTVGGQQVSTFTGLITAGKFDGASATLVVTAVSLDVISCLLGSGISSATSTATLVVA
ncbi:hypothetical protein [Actinosynnema mirum]|uniref:Ig-like domain-containing protein n=1 Tax=Actinosynnema mirum (strain ATCC 29888 / DSM 43827 / JCM 3225 / NBRC 14064 / NCIMB 13271 / NRRL B-12336 / IMRU 3971 / 101) TaxID=446462 RepID=C6WED3_ACTMD|nr:hypothetical protein [Actinosynnema mirum]ACU37733.1 hypothetical protein Amir_3854 [Actinosynnema mirum DSM 43827]